MSTKKATILPANKTLQKEMGLRPWTWWAFPNAINFAIKGVAELRTIDARKRKMIDLKRISESKQNAPFSAKKKGPSFAGWAVKKTWQRPTLPHSCVQYHRR